MCTTHKVNVHFDNCFYTLMLKHTCKKKKFINNNKKILGAHFLRISFKTTAVYNA